MSRATDRGEDGGRRHQRRRRWSARRKLTSPEDYAEEFVLTLDPPCAVDFDRFLVQLGLPGPDRLTLWYALPPADARRAGDLRPRIQAIEVEVDAGWIPAKTEVPVILHTPGGKGRIEIAGLDSGQRYRLKIAWGDQVVDLEASTAPAPGANGGFRFLAWSCLQPYGYRHKGDQPHIPLGTANSLRLLERRATAARDRPDFALALGDQVYVDENAHRRGKRALLVGDDSGECRYQGDARPYLDVAYRHTFGIPPVDEAFKNLPHVMMWDDHEIRDGWGSLGDEYPDHGGQPSRWTAHLQAAREQFRDFQALRNPLPLQLGRQTRQTGRPGAWTSAGLDDFMRPEPPAESEPEPRHQQGPQPRETHFQFSWGKAATFFVMDLRSRRDVKAAGGPRVISEAQLQDLADWLVSVDPQTPMLFVLGSPLPLFQERAWHSWLEERLFRRVRADDVRDSWWSEANRRQRDRIITLLADHFERAPRHRLLVCSGDSHFSEVVELRSHDGRAAGAVFGHEVVTSGLALTSFYRLQGPWSPAPRVLAGRVHARGYGRFRGPSFAELIVTPSRSERPEAPPELAVTFTPATTTFGRTLANTAEITQFKLHLPVGPRTVQPRGCPCQDRPSRPADAATTGGDVEDRDPEEIREERRIQARTSGCLSRISTRTGWWFFRRFVERDFRNEKASWEAPGWRGEITYREVIEAERDQIARRRAVLGRAAPRPDDPDLFAVALSGGGVRSAALSFGFLRELDRGKLLAQTDYLSTVSGGGYAGGHLQAAIHGKARAGKLDPDAGLLSEAGLKRLSRKGRYLAPGKGLRAALELMTLVSAYLMSLPVTLIPLLAMVVAMGMLVEAGASHWPSAALAGQLLLNGLALAALLAIIARLFIIPGWPLGRQARRAFHYFEAFTLSALVLCAFGSVSRWMARLPGKLNELIQSSLGSLAAAPEDGPLGSILTRAFTQLQVLARDQAYLMGPLAALLTAVIIGYLANANSLSMHALFADRILRAFLCPGRGRDEELRLADLAASDQRPLLGPYPLINGCLNLLGERDPAFAGARASDYFLLSPLYCGAKLTGYASTRWRRYREFSLAKAVAVSAASISPGMGNASSTAFSVLASVFNWRLGIWMSNPRRPPHWLPYFWPWYGLLELTNHTSSKRRLLNVTDGGFIDNLGVFELLRRRCKVILAIDTTHDPTYDFHYLQNLVIRARQELGVHIALPKDAASAMRPSVIRGMSARQFVLAPITRAASRPGPEYRGLFIYAKAALSEEHDSFEGAKARTKARAYKKFHPSFPQESTFDQFFDDAQWEAYYELGQEIAEAVIRDPEVLRALEQLSTRGQPLTRLVQLLREQQRNPPPRNGRPAKKAPTPPGTPLPPPTPIPIGHDDPTVPGVAPPS